MDTGINLFNFILFINLKSNESWMFDYILRKLSEVDCWQFCEGKMNESRRFLAICHAAVLQAEYLQQKRANYATTGTGTNHF